MQVLGGIAAFIILCILVWKVLSDAFTSLGHALWIIPLALIAGVIFLIMYFQRRTEANISKGVPAHRPMQVNIRTEQGVSTIHGRKHRLHIDVKMSPDDWQAIKDANLGNYAFFNHDKVTPLDNHYSVGHLLRVKHVDFDTMPQLEEAKEQLIAGLHALRTRIDSQKEFRSDTTLHQEKYEI